MANPQRGEVALEVQGVTYLLVIDLNAMCEIEDILTPPGATPDERVSFRRVVEVFVKSTDMRYLRAIFWGALRRHHPDVPLKGVSELFDELGGVGAMPVVVETINKLLTATRPDARDRASLQATEGNGRPPGEVAAPLIGTRSTSRRAKSASAATSSGA